MDSMSSLDSFLPSTTDDPVLDNLDARDLLRFSRVCVAAKLKVDSYIKRHFSIYSILDRFFARSDSIAFRYLMRMTGMLVSGSSVLQLFDRSFYAGSDLDVFVNQSQASVVGEWLKARGYEFVLSEDQQNRQTTYEQMVTPGSPFEGEDCITHLTVFHFYEHFEVLNFTAQNPTRKIQVVLTRDSPLSVIMGFHSTVVLNVMTYSKAYCLYPKATLVERRNLLNCWRSPVIYRKAIDKYIERGWRFLPFLQPSETLDPRCAFSFGARRLGDKRCWTLEFELFNDERKELETQYPSHNVSNDVEFDVWMATADTTCHLILNARIFQSEKLTRQYMFTTSCHLDEIIDAFSLVKSKYKNDQFLDSRIPEVYKLLAENCG